MTPRKSFLLAVAMIALVVGMATIAWLLVFWERLTPAEEALFTYVLTERFAGVFVAAFFLLCALALIVGAFLHYYLIPLRRLVEETTLIATVNPLHRISPSGSRDLAHLAKAINEGAERFQRLRETVRDEIEQTASQLVTERNLLAAIIARSGEGVVVCNLEGRIMMVNGRARELLSGPDGQGSGRESVSEFIGLGRSLMDFVDPDITKKAMLELGKHPGSSCSSPLRAEFTMACGGRRLAAGAALLCDEGGNGLGYFFTFNEMAETGTEADGSDVAVRKVKLQKAPYVDLTPEARSLGEDGRMKPTEAASWRGRPEFFDFKLFNQIGRRPELEKRSLKEIAYTVFDTETTGLYPSLGDEIISIGAVRILNGRILREEGFYRLVDPKRSIRAEAVRVHGLTSEMLRGKPAIETVMPLFYQFSKETVLVGHNAAFDMRFLELKEPQTGIRFDQPLLDTLLLSLVVHAHQESHSLEALAELLGVEVGQRHMALADALLTGEIFLRLIPLLKQAGIHTLQEALEACMDTAYAQLRY